MEKYPITFYWLPVILVCMLIFFLSSQTKLPDVPVHIPFLDKFEHTTIYAILGFLAHRAMVNDKDRKSWFKKPALYAVIFCFLFGISDEFHQYFVPNRECSAFDAMADLLGGFIGQWIYANIWLTRFFKQTL
jgi:VanZ family protein